MKVTQGMSENFIGTLEKRVLVLRVVDIEDHAQVAVVDYVAQHRGVDASGYI